MSDEDAPRGPRLVDGDRVFVMDPAQTEAFVATTALRWRAGVLEQCWQGTGGNIRWEPVPEAEGTPKGENDG